MHIGIAAMVHLQVRYIVGGIRSNRFIRGCESLVAGCGKRLLWPSYKAIVRVLDRVGVEKQQGELNSPGTSKIGARSIGTT
jgi:hypothetical protein